MAAKKKTANDPPQAPPSPNAEQEPPFEASIRRLGEIVDTLEAGELPLEESLKLFEEGVQLARASQAKLDRAEKRVEELLSIDEEGNPVVREMDETES